MSADVGGSPNVRVEVAAMVLLGRERGCPKGLLRALRVKAVSSPASPGCCSS